MMGASVLERAACGFLLSVALVIPAHAQDATTDETPKHNVLEERRNEYKPSAARIYIGSMLVGISNPLGPGLLTDLGATLAFDFHPGDLRLFFIGCRTSFVGDSSGVLGAFDLDFGIRPRLVARRETALALVIGGGIGGGFITSDGGVGFFHLPARFGVSLDIGDFTTQALVGPALIYGRNALGAVESSFEAGARF